MKMHKIRAIYKKEIMDLLRDKKTLIMMVIVPLVLYPLLMIAVLLISSSVSQSMQEDTYHVAVVEDMTPQNQTDTGYDREAFVSMIEDTKDEYEYHLKVVGEDQKACEQDLKDEKIDSYLVVSAEDKTLKMQIYYLSSVTNSNTVSDMLSDKANAYKKNIQKNLLQKAGLDADFILEPVEVKFEDIASKEESLGNILGSILPFLLIISILMGAIYPAIDTTAGEKERGTLETLLTLPVKGVELIMGKFLAVSTIAVVSALLNLISMGLMGGYIYATMLEASENATQVDMGGFIPAVLVIVLCIVTFALLVSAICMCVTAFAKSFKEANNYITPLMLVIMLTGYIGFIPNIKFNTVMASVPVANICLLIKEMLAFKYDFSLIFIVLLTNVAYSAIAIWLLGHIYSAENVMFSEGGSGLQLFDRRSEIKRADRPALPDGILVAALSMLLLLYVGSILQLKFLLVGLFASQLLLVAVPIFAAWYTKRNIRITFSIQRPEVVHVIAAVILEIGVFLLLLIMSDILSDIWPSDAQHVTSSFDTLMKGAGFVPCLLVIALTPAICEEGLFRGYLFSAARSRLKPAAAILLTAAVFGLYHMSIVKFFTTGILGIAFAYVVYQSGSIFCSSLMHFMNNAVSVLIMFYPKQMGKMFPALFVDELSLGQGGIFLAVAWICIGVGVFLLSNRKNSLEK